MKAELETSLSAPIACSPPSNDILFFSPRELDKLNPLHIPKHVAFIPDGNRRWAKKHKIAPEDGHRIGADTLLNIIMASNQIGIETITFYIFSTENWSRPTLEIRAQMILLERSLIEQKQRMLDNGVRFRTIGDLSKFPKRIIELVEETKEATKHCSKITVVFAMNYGGRDDVCRAVKKIVDAYERGEIAKEEISEGCISRHLDTAGWPDPDLLIRTSGESRVSNFLLWQISYAEIYFSDLYWPEFSPRNLLEAVYEFQSRERRLGG